MKVCLALRRFLFGWGFLETFCLELEEGECLAERITRWRLRVKWRRRVVVMAGARLRDRENEVIGMGSSGNKNQIKSNFVLLKGLEDTVEKE